MTRAPAPPHGFRGSFSSDPGHTEPFSSASGPFRIQPLGVVRPADAPDLSLLVHWAHGEGIPLIPRGAGTGMPGGNVGPGLVLDLNGWSSASEVDRDARTIRVGPGVTGSEVESAATAAGLFFPAMPSSADRCTLGGMIANNAAGARSFAYGPVRDWVETLDVMLADGSTITVNREAAEDPTFLGLEGVLGASEQELLDRWPDVRKNSSGYALDLFLPTSDAVSLLTGSEGTLGIVTSALLRLAPQPEARAVVLLAVPDLDGLGPVLQVAGSVGAAACEFFAGRFLDVAGLRRHELTGAVVGEAPAAVLLELDGTLDAVEEGLAAVDTLAQRMDVPYIDAKSETERTRLWAVRHGASPVIAAQAAEGLVSMQFIEDSVVPPHRLPEYLRGLDVILGREETDAVVFGHAGDGNVHVNPLVDVRRRDWRDRVRRILDSTVDLVAGLGGTLTGEHGDGRLRAPFQERIWGARVAGAFEAVKRHFDPRGILNPGVVVPEPGQDPLAGLSPERRLD